MRNNSSPFVQTVKLYLYWAWLEVGSVLRSSKRTNARARSAVLLSFRLPPQFDSGTHRATSFLRYAEDCDWNIFAITNHNPEKEPNEAGIELLDSIGGNISIYEAEKCFVETSWSLTPRLDGDFSTALSLVKIALKTFGLEKPAVIVASSPPFCFAIAGFFLSRMTGLPLILDYRDEWTLCPFNFVSKTKLDKWFEKRCIKQAALMIYTTESHLKNHQTAFSIPQSKQAIVYNGWDDSQSKKEGGKRENFSDSLIISYVGRLSEHVDLVEFITFFEQAVTQYLSLGKKITLRFIGPKTRSYEDYINDLIKRKSAAITIESIGLVKKSEALKLMDSSDYLLMMCNAELATYIPGKIYDYLSRRVPILAYGCPGEVSRILELTNSGVFVEYGDKLSMSKALKSKIPDLRNNLILESWLQQRTRKSQANMFFEILSDFSDH